MGFWARAGTTGRAVFSERVATAAGAGLVRGIRSFYLGVGAHTSPLILAGYAGTALFRELGENCKDFTRDVRRATCRDPHCLHPPSEVGYRVLIYRFRV